MAKHLGYRATLDKPSQTWIGWAWDMHAGKYRRKRGHATEAAARAWAKGEHANFQTRLASIASNPTRALADAYVKHLEVIKKRAPGHIANVRRAVDGLAAAVSDLQHPGAANACEDWLAALPLAASTRVMRRNSVVAMCNWAVRRKLMLSNPLSMVETERPDQVIKEQFDLTELRLLANADTRRPPPRAFKKGQRFTAHEKEVQTDGRDPFHLHLCLLLYLGLRTAEAEGLKWEDVDMEGQVVRVMGKGRKERLVPVQAELRTVLEAHRPASGTGSVLGLSEGQTPWLLESFLRRQQVTQGHRSPHSLRHCYAGLMTASGVPSILLAAYMGHSSQATTAGYSKLAARYEHVARDWKRGEFRLRSPP